jgi:glycosyltransferase involved in cell wall biosynthesis
MPKVSIIVPVYNAEQYLDRCIESILSQTFINKKVMFKTVCTTTMATEP